MHVAPYKGAWIEIDDDIESLAYKLGRSLQGSVD